MTTDPVAVELGRAEVIRWAKRRFGLRVLESTLEGVPRVAAEEAAQLCKGFITDSPAELARGKEYGVYRQDGATYVAVYYGKDVLAAFDITAALANTGSVEELDARRSPSRLLDCGETREGR